MPEIKILNKPAGFLVAVFNGCWLGMEVFLPALVNGEEADIRVDALAPAAFPRMDGWNFRGWIAGGEFSGMPVAGRFAAE